MVRLGECGIGRGECGVRVCECGIRAGECRMDSSVVAGSRRCLRVSAEVCISPLSVLATDVMLRDFAFLDRSDNMTPLRTRGDSTGELPWASRQIFKDPRLHSTWAECRAGALTEKPATMAGSAHTTPVGFRLTEVEEQCKRNRRGRQYEGHGGGARGQWPVAGSRDASVFLVTPPERRFNECVGDNALIENRDGSRG